jgi:hypothetical protein
MRSRAYDRRTFWRISGVSALTVALVACGAPSSPNARSNEHQDSNADPSDSSASLSVELSPLEGAAGEIEYRLTNTSVDAVRFFPWDTAAKGKMIVNLFDVRMEGQAVAFAGPHVHLAAPDPADFTELSPGETLTTVIRLPDYYKMARPGSYDVRARPAAPTVIQADQTSAYGSITVPSSDITVDVDEGHVHRAPDALVEKASGACESACQVRCAISDPQDPTFCIAECFQNLCEAKITGCTAGDRTRLEDAEDSAHLRIFNSFSGVNSGNEFTAVFGDRNDGKVALVSSILNKMEGDVPIIPYRCNAPSTILGTFQGATVVCAPRTDFSQLTAVAFTRQQPNARVEVCGEMFADPIFTTGVVVHESSHHFGTDDFDPNPLNDPEAYREYVMSFPD